MGSLKLARGTAADLVLAASAPGSAAVASGARSAQGEEYDNSLAGNLFPFGEIELVLTFAVAPTAGRRINIYLSTALDGTNYNVGDAANAPSQAHLLGWVSVRAVTTQQRLRVQGPNLEGKLSLPASKLKILIDNQTDQQISASWSAKLYPEYWASS